MRTTRIRAIPVTPISPSALSKRGSRDPSTQRYLQDKGWKVHDSKDGWIVYEGPYSTKFGELRGRIYERRYAGMSQFLCYALELPKSIRKHEHSDCFRWDNSRDAFFIHFEDNPKDIVSAIVSVEHTINQAPG